MNQYQEILAKWQSYEIRTTTDLDRHLQGFRILFAYHSGRIENEEITYENTREIFDKGRVTSFSGNPQALFEQQNQKICYEYLKKHILAKTPLNLDLIKEIQSILATGIYDERRFLKNGERPGQFKKHDYVTRLLDVGSAPEDVERELLELIEEISGFSGDNVLVAATYLHAGFEYIHPFADANGRAGRSLLNYFLLTHDHPPLIVHEEDREVYYNSLRRFDESEELEPLLSFFREQTVKTWKRLLKQQDQSGQHRKKLADFT